jgi:glycosyltransferase involved in cell wall biosynthesis
MEGPLVLYAGILCRLLGFPVVQEMCEWFPGDATRPALTHWLYRKVIFAQATGILVISKWLEGRVRQRSIVANPRLLIHLLPSMVDSQRFVNASRHTEGTATAIPYFLWCGIGYTEDVLFLIRALALVNREGYRCKLRIISAAFLLWGPQTIIDYAAKQGLPPEAIDLMGCVDDRTLEMSYKSAAALLLPLWDDDMSRARMPNKLAEYLASGRPAITCKVGDLLDFLIPGTNAYLARPGDEQDFANKMIEVLLDPSRADRIGAAGQRTCISRFDYRSQIETLAQFFVQCIELHR